MSLSTKDIKSRTSSVKNIRKITRSMQLISVAKMQRNVRLATQSRQYSVVLEETLSRIAKDETVKHPFFAVRPVKKVLLVLVTSNRGLAGSYNANVLRAADTYRKKLKSKKHLELQVLAVGKKAAIWAKKRGLKLVAMYDALGDTPFLFECKPVVKHIVDGFLQETIDTVQIIYTFYKNSLIQTVKQKTLLPFRQSKGNEEYLTDKNEDQTYENGYPLHEITAGAQADMFTAHITTSALIPDMKYEPDRESVIDYLASRGVETQLYQSLLDAAASEHSSRMMTMQNATNNAGDLIYNLTLLYNKKRQSKITQEVAEIIAGMEAQTDEEDEI